MTCSDAPIARPLETIRAELDEIDEQIFALVVRRAALADEVRRAKTDTGAAALRPAREAQMLRRFSGFDAGAMRLEQIWRLWRELIMANARLQFPFVVDTVAASRNHELWDLGRAHFCFETDMEAHDSALDALNRAAGGEARIALLPAADASWWHRLAAPPGALRIFAALPMIVEAPDAAPQALVAGDVAIAPSGDDVTVILLKAAGSPLGVEEVRAAMASSGHDILYTLTGGPAALVGVSGLLETAGRAPVPVGDIAGLEATVIGAHAAPVVAAGAGG